jgi:predicted SnoaL-like aldol condensation-catalyzing enzyme
VKRAAIVVGLALALGLPGGSSAQVQVQANSNHDKLMVSRDPHLAANKRLVYDFWRSVIEAGHMELADKYLAEGYVQHNPNVPTGRAGFVQVFSKLVQPKPIEAEMKSPLVSMVAEGDLVVLSFVSKQRDPSDSTKTYTTAWFDMFRVADGKIAEHWDNDRKE